MSFLRLNDVQEILIEAGRADDAEFINEFARCFAMRPCDLTVNGTYNTARRADVTDANRRAIMRKGAEILEPYRTVFH